MNDIRQELLRLIALNLAELAASILPDRAFKYFLFGTIKQFSLTSPPPLLDDIFFRPGGGGARFPLVQAPLRAAA